MKRSMVQEEDGIVKQRNLKKKWEKNIILKILES